MVGGEKLSSRQCYERAVSLDPADANAWNNLGVQGGTDGHSGEKCFARAVELAPTDPEYWNNLGTSGGGEIDGKHYDNKGCYLKAIENNPRDGQPYFNLADAGGTPEHDRRSLAIKALELTDSIHQAWLVLGVEGGGKVNGIEYSKKECFIRAIEFKNDFGQGWNNLGTVGGGEVMVGPTMTNNAL